MRRDEGGGATEMRVDARRIYTESAEPSVEHSQLHLFEGALRFVGQAAAELEDGHGDAMWILVNRAQAIIDELNSCLDMSEGEVSARLRTLYGVCKRRLVEAGMQRDPAGLEDVFRLLGELRSRTTPLAVAH